MTLRSLLCLDYGSGICMAERPVILVVSLVKVQCGEHMVLIKDHMQDLVLIIILQLVPMTRIFEPTILFSTYNYL